MWRLVGGIGVLLALVGLIVSVLGIAIFVSNFGNALLAVGAAGVSGGIVLVGISLVLKDLAGLAARLDTLSLSGGSSASAASAQAFAPAPAPAFQPALEDEEEEEVDTYAPPPPPPAPPPVREPPPERTARPTLPPFVRPRPSEPPAEPAPAPAADARRGRILGRLTEGDSLASRLRLPTEPPTDAPPEPVVPAPLERVERAERQVPVPRPFAPPAPPPAPVRRAEPPRPPEVAEPTILKSGIVGGMAYTLYSDGSIQAELPDGVLRFASLQELRDHVARASQPR